MPPITETTALSTSKHIMMTIYLKVDTMMKKIAVQTNDQLFGNKEAMSINVRSPELKVALKTCNIHK